MEVPKSTVRFTQVVKECGRPEPVTLWTDPKKDREFQTAVRENQIMTLIQETVGTHKDFGVVGFHQVDHATYWKFPKSLDGFEGKRVIGIKYDLLEIPKPKDPVNLTKEPARKAPLRHAEKPIKQPGRPPPPKVQLQKAKPEPTKPSGVRYRVTIRCTATVDLYREVEARTAKQAGELALDRVANEAVEFSAEKISRKVTEVHRASKT